MTYYDPSGYGCKETDKINDNSDEIKAIYDPDMVMKLYESQDLRYKVSLPDNRRYKTVEDYQAAVAPSTVLRDQLEMCHVQNPRFPCEAHHIVPINQAQRAIEHLASLGIDGNSAANGVYLPSKSIKGNPQVVHSQESSGMMRHGTKYINKITDEICATTTRDAAIEVLNTYRRGLLDGSIDYLYVDE